MAAAPLSRGAVTDESDSDTLSEKRMRLQKPKGADPFWPSLHPSRIEYAIAAEKRLCRRLPEPNRVIWDFLVDNWYVDLLYSMVEEFALAHESFYVGVTSGVGWRWHWCHGHTEGFVSHDKRFSYTFPIIYERGIATMEEMVIEFVRSKPLLDAKCRNAKQYVRGPVSDNCDNFLYICV